MGIINKLMKGLKKCNFFKKIIPYGRNNRKTFVLSANENNGIEDYTINCSETDERKICSPEIKYKQSLATDDLSTVNAGSKTQVTSTKRKKNKDLDDPLTIKSKKICSCDNTYVPRNEISNEIVYSSISLPNIEVESSITTTLNNDLSNSCNIGPELEEYSNNVIRSIPTLPNLSDQNAPINGTHVTYVCVDFAQFPRLSTIMPEINIVQSDSHLETSIDSCELNLVVDLQTSGQTSTPELRTAGQTSTSELRTAGLTSIPELRTAGQTSTPELRTAGQTSTPELRTAGQTSTPELRTAGQTSTPELRTAGQISTPEQRTAGQTLTSKLRASKLHSSLELQIPQIDSTFEMRTFIMPELSSMVELRTSEQTSMVELQTSEQTSTFESQMSSFISISDSETFELNSTLNSGLSELFSIFDPLSGIEAVVPEENLNSSESENYNNNSEDSVSYWNYRVDGRLTSDSQDNAYQEDYQENELNDNIPLFRLRRRLYSSIRGGLFEFEIDMLPTRIFKISEEEKSFLRNENSIDRSCIQCKICLEEYENGQILRCLPCFHEFHELCIHTWIKKSLLCPFCRTSVIETQ